MDRLPWSLGMAMATIVWSMNVMATAKTIAASTRFLFEDSVMWASITEPIWPCWRLNCTKLPLSPLCSESGDRVCSEGRAHLWAQGWTHAARSGVGRPGIARGAGRGGAGVVGGVACRRLDGAGEG